MSIYDEPGCLADHADEASDLADREAERQRSRRRQRLLTMAACGTPELAAWAWCEIEPEEPAEEE